LAKYRENATETYINFAYIKWINSY